MEQQRRLILDWVAAGHLDRENLDAALSRTGAQLSAAQWQAFARYTLLLGGIVACCCGVIFFFAYNWQALGKLQKFGLLEALFIAAVLFFAAAAGRDDRLRTALTLGLFLLTGALLALLGQTYQTGADTWQLFASWAALCAPFLMVGRSSMLWIAGLAVCQTALFLYFFTFRGNWWSFSYTESALVVALLVNSLIALVLEALYPEGSLNRLLPASVRRVCGLRNRIAAQLSALAANFSVSCLLIVYLLDWEAEGLLALTLYLGWLTGSLYCYRFLRSDLLLVAASVLSVVVVSVTFAARLLLDNGADAGSFMLLALITLGVSTPAVLWLKRLSAQADHPEEVNHVQ